MKRIKVQIVKSTKKAHLIKNDQDRQGWVQKRWLKNDDTVAIKTFEKATASFEEHKASFVAKRKFNNDLHTIKIDRQSEKAIASLIILEVPGGDSVERFVWFPKSMCEPGQLEGTALVPGWMIQDRQKEAVNTYCPRGYYERHRSCKGEVTTLLSGVQTIDQSCRTQNHPKNTAVNAKAQVESQSAISR